MPITSKTGLLPSVKKNVKAEVQNTVTVEMPKIVIPAPFTLRPFAGIYNPFPYGCSILCNHPADFEAKSLVKKAKDAWATEGKSLIDLEELPTGRYKEKINRPNHTLGILEDHEDKVPEELFRKYTDTDSRPITPAPTLVSIATKASQNLRARRCMTPDPTSFLPTKEKTLLVLDLRRSHSQETVCWQGGQAVEPFLEGDVILQQSGDSRATSPSSQNLSQPKKKKTPRKKTAPTSATASSLKTQTSRESDSKVQTQHSSASQSPSKGSITQDHESASNKIPEISPQSSSSDMIIKRRGKKRKGKKTGKEGLKEVQGIPDPGETQVSALENDSREGSSAPSLRGEDKPSELSSDEAVSNVDTKIKIEPENNSFLNWEILKQLQRQLDQEVVDSELNVKRKIALEEALRHKTKPKNLPQGEEMKNLKKEFQLLIKDSEKWLLIPRVFTRRSARFELPMDSRLLNSMTPLQYVQKYVFASPERLVLYNHVFNLHKEEPEDDDEKDRIMMGKNVITALSKIMGRTMTIEEGNELQHVLDWEDNAQLDFRTFTGIAATCERLMGPRFTSSMPSQKEDPRHEVEIADFETLEGKLLRVGPDLRLVKILRSIRDL